MENAAAAAAGISRKGIHDPADNTPECLKPIGVHPGEWCFAIKGHYETLALNGLNGEACHVALLLMLDVLDYCQQKQDQWRRGGIEGPPNALLCMFKEEVRRDDNTNVRWTSTKEQGDHDDKNWKKTGKFLPTTPTILARRLGYRKGIGPRRDAAKPTPRSAPDGRKRATVIVDSVTMYSEMSATSSEVAVLHKDDEVFISLSIGASDGQWCSVTQSEAGGKSGNVRCDSLTQEPAFQEDISSPAPPTAVALPTARAVHIPRAPLNVRVYFVPIGNPAFVDMQYLAGYYKQRFGLDITTLRAIVLDPSTFDPIRQQNEVEGVIKLLNRAYPALANDGRSILIGITEADIYTTSENWRFALGQRDEGRFAVASSARWI